MTQTHLIPQTYCFVFETVLWSDEAVHLGTHHHMPWRVSEVGFFFPSGQWMAAAAPAELRIT